MRCVLLAHMFDMHTLKMCLELVQPYNEVTNTHTYNILTNTRLKDDEHDNTQY